MLRRRLIGKTAVDSIDGKYQIAAIYGQYMKISNDYGVTWNDLTSAGSRNWSGVAISATGQHIVAVAYNYYIMYSANYGASWSLIESPRNWAGVAISSDGRRITAFEEYGGIFVSPDGGGLIYNAIDDTPRSWSCVAMSDNGQYQLAGLYGEGLYRSINYGASWHPTGVIADATGVAVSPIGDIMYSVKEVNILFGSSNYGVTWGVPASPTGSHQDVAISGDGKYILLGQYNGNAQLSSNFGVSFVLQLSTYGGRRVATSYSGKYQLAAGVFQSLYINSNYEQAWSVGLPSAYYMDVAINRFNG